MDSPEDTKVVADPTSAIERHQWPEVWMARCLYLYMLRVEILGFLFLYPLSGWALQTPLLRGLADLEASQVTRVAVFSAGLSIFLVITSKLVLLWGKARVAPRDDAREVALDVAQKRARRRFLSVIGVLSWMGFMSGVRAACEGPGGHCPVGGLSFAGKAIYGYATAWIVSACAEIVAFATWPKRPIALTPGLATLIEVIPAPYADRFNSFIDRLRRGGSETRLRPKIFLMGYRFPCDGKPRWLPGHVAALLLTAILCFWVEDMGPTAMTRVVRVVRFAFSAGLLWLLFRPIPLMAGRPAAVLVGACVGGASREFVPWFFERDGFDTISTLSVLLAGILLAFMLASAIAFALDRYRVPILTALVALVTAFSWLGGGGENFFFSKPVRPESLEKALTPSAVLSGRPAEPIILVAAAGGGIQSGAWTARVLAALRDDKDFGPDFEKHLTVMSGVSGGSVGLIFYLGTYQDVWKAKLTPQEVTDRAMGSSLIAAAMGLVYPDLHQLLLPFPTWNYWGPDPDRGWALERSFAQRAGRWPGPMMLDLPPTKEANRFPVIILNSTLSQQGLPAVFSNSRFPDPSATPRSRRGIQGFQTDLRLDTRLETAARMSATFPLVSPVARPNDYRARDAFLDGGYFDNSGIYSLMSWLEQARQPQTAGAPLREVLLIQISAFPESASSAVTSARMPWYRQLFVPVEAVMKVRETGQATRIGYELPILLESLKEAFHFTRVEFRYEPSPRCSLEPPPLSWHLNKFERDCVREGWDHKDSRAGRERVAAFLRDSRVTAGTPSGDPPR